MLKPDGYGEVIAPPRVCEFREHDVVTCIHCGSVSMTRSGLTGKLEVLIFRADGSHYMRECGFCRNCYKPICPKCDGKPCDNRFRRMEEDEAAAQKLICI